MATCDWCIQEMTDKAVVTCAGNTEVEFPDGTTLPPIPYPYDNPCHDCGIHTGGFHHPGCDVERCPKCQGQLISCGCLDDESEDDDELRY